VSAEIAIRDERCWRYMVCGRSRGAVNDCVEIGAVLPAPISPETANDCFDYAESVCRIAGLTYGTFHVEMILTDKGPALVEVNPRAMGGMMPVLYKLLTGTDFCDYIIKLQVGEVLPAIPTGVHGTVTARRLLSRGSTQLPNVIDLRQLTGADSKILAFENFMPTCGSEVREQQLLGRFAVRGNTWKEAMQLANDLVVRFEQVIGIPLIMPQDVGDVDVTWEMPEMRSVADSITVRTLGF